MESGKARASLNLKVSAALKAEVEAYAGRLGISVNSAAAVLIDRGLEAERQRDEDR